MIKVAFFDAKPYEMEALLNIAETTLHNIREYFENRTLVNEFG